MKKIVVVDPRSAREISKFPREVQLRFKQDFEILEKDGRLVEPEAKKLISTRGLFEIRVKYKGQWRAIYAYATSYTIVILSAFAKKTQKTPVEELNKAKKRLLEYT